MSFHFKAVFVAIFCTASTFAADRYWVATGTSGPWNTTASWSATPGGASGASIPGNGDQAIFDGNKATPCILTAAVSVSSITISTSASTGYGGYIDLSTRTLTVQQNFTLNAGTFYARTSSITVNGNWTISTAANFIANTSSVTFNATTTNHLIDTANDPFYKLIFNGVGGGWTTTGHAVTVSSFTTMLNGNFTIADTTMTVAGDFQVTAGSTLTIKADLEVDGGNLIVSNASNINSNSTSTLRLSGTGTLGGGTSAVTLPGVSLLGAATTTLGSKVTILGALTNAASHTFDVSASNFGITISSGWLNSGTYTSRTGSVTFNGSSLNTPITTTGKTFYNLGFNGTGSWNPLGGPITVTSSTYVNGGTFSIADSSLTSAGNIAVTSPGILNIQNDVLINGGGLTNTGTISGASTPTITLALAAGTLGGTGNTTLPALALAGAFTTTLGGPITVQGVLSNAATHTLDVSATNFGITVSSGWINSGIYTARSGSVTFTGSMLNTPITTTGKTFYNLNFNGTGSWNSLNGPITVTSSTYVTAGTFRIADSSFTSAGNISVAAAGILDLRHDVLISAGGGLTNTGTITSLSTPTITMGGAAGTLGGTGTTLLPGLTLAGAFTTTLGGAITVQGLLTNPATHTLDASVSNYGITISSSWSNAGIYTARSSSVTFAGSIPNGTIATNVYAFYNASFNSGTWRTITSPMTVSNNLIINGGSFSVINSSLTVTSDINVNSGGTFSINHDVLINGGDLTNDGTITSLSTPTVTLNGVGTLGGLGSTVLPRITLGGVAQTTTLGGNIVLSGSATINANHTLDANNSGNYQITISSWWYNNGIFNPQAGQVVVNSTATLSGSTTFYDFTTTTPGITITFQKGTTFFVTDALTATGASGNPIRWRSTTPGQYWELSLSGTASLSQLDVQDSDARSGLVITPVSSTDSGNNRNWNFGGGVRTWWGSVNTDWSNINNWDSIVPTASEKALIVSTATHMPTLTVPVVISTLSIVATSSLTLNGFNLTLSSFSNAGIFAFKGNEQVSIAPDTLSGSTITYNATSGSVPILSTWTYVNLIINGTGGTFVPSGDLSIKQGYTFIAGSLLHTNNDTLIFAGTSGIYAITTGGKPLYNITINGAGGGWLMQDFMTVLSSLTLTAGTLDTKTAVNNGLAIGGEWLGNGGTFVTNNSSISFTGSGTHLRIRSGNQNFWRLAFTGSGSWQTDTNQITVTSTVFVNTGTLMVAGGSSMTVTGNPWINTGATLDIEGDMALNGGAFLNAGSIIGTSSATVTVAGAGTIGGSGNTMLPSLSLTGNAQTTTLASAISMTGGLINGTGHTLDVSASNFSLTVSSQWANAGTYTARSGSVTFAGAGANLPITTNGSAFYNLNFNGIGSWTPMTNPITVTSSTYVLGGVFHVANSSLTSAGNVNVGSSGTFDIRHDVLINGGGLTNSGTITSASTPTVTLALAAGTLGGSGSTTLPALTLAGAFTTTLGGPITVQGLFTNPATHTLDASPSNYGITISSSWANTGIYTARSSSVTFMGTIPNGTIMTNLYAFYNLVFNGGTWRNMTNTVTVSSNVQINGGVFSIGGSSLTVTGDVDINAGGTFNINNDVLINGGDFTNDGTLGGSSTPTVTLNGNGTLGGSSTSTFPQLVLSGAAQTTTLGGAIILLSSTTIGASHSLDVSASNYQITISSWLANNGTFMAQSGTVLINSTATLTGSATFYNLTSTIPGLTLTLQKGTTFYITNALTLTGASGNPIRLRSTTGGQSWELSLSGSAAVSQVDVQDSDARLGLVITPTSSIDSGNNRNWNFGGGVRTWWGSLNTDWSNVYNWDSIVPGVSEKALIVSTATHMPTLTAPVVISTLSIVATSSLTLNGFNLTLSSFSNAGIFAFKGNEQVSIAPDTLSGSTITYNATSGSVPILSTWTYVNLIINGTGGTFVPTGDLSIKQGYTFSAGTLLHPNNETFSFTGTSGIYAITTGGKPLYNVTINGSGGSWLMQDFMTVLSSLTLAAGTLDTKTAVNNGLAIGGEWLGNGGTFITNNSSISFTGSGSHLRIRSGNQNFWRLAFTGPGSWQTDTNQITVTSTVFVNAGTLMVAGGSSMTVTGNPWINTGATLDIEGDMAINGGGFLNLGTILSASTPTLTIAGAAGTIGGTGTTLLPALTLAGAFTTTLGGSLTLQGVLTNPATHTLDASASNFGITISSSWANAGIYTARSSSVTFTGSIPNGTIATNSYAFYNLAFNGGAWRNITNTVTVSSSVQLTGGVFSLGGSSLTVAGDINVKTGSTFNINHDVLINGGNFTNAGTLGGLSTPTVILNGSGILGGSSTSTLPQLLLSGAGQTTTLGGAVMLLSSTTIGANHTLDVGTGNYQITISSWFANNGIFIPQAGTVVVNSTATLTGSTTFYNFTATTPGITMTFQAGTTQYVTQTWSVGGVAGNKVKFRSTTASPYAFRVSISSFVSNVDVQNCIASSQTIYAGQPSTNGGGNTNWVFDFPPNAITSLAAFTQLTGDIRLTWNAPADADDNPLGAGSQYAIEWATYTAVAWSTSTLNDTGNPLTSHIFISTNAVTAGTFQVYLSTGFSGNVTYYFEIWTKDPLGTWSLGFSNMASTSTVLTLGMTLSVLSYDFGLVHMAATTVSTSPITITNTGNNTETYTLSVATSGASGLWGVQASTPTVLNEFVLFAGFNATTPPSPNSFVNSDALTNTPTAATSSIFAIGQSGLSTPSASTRDLWLRLDMPPTTTMVVPQQMTVTISASSP